MTNIYCYAYPDAYPDAHPCDLLIAPEPPTPDVVKGPGCRRNALFLYVGNSYTTDSLGPIYWEIHSDEIDLSNFDVVTFNVYHSRTGVEELTTTGSVQIVEGSQFVMVPLTAAQVLLIAEEGYGLSHKFNCIVTSSSDSNQSFRAASGILEIRK